VWRRAHRERLLRDATISELEADADRIAAAVAELDAWDVSDQAGIDALEERAAWSAELAAELREQARRARRVASVALPLRPQAVSCDDPCAGTRTLLRQPLTERTSCLHRRSW